MEFTDRVLTCSDCGAEFVFTSGEQLFSHDKQFKNEPRHCKQCKAKRVRGGSRARPETRTNCSQCGAATTVPFKPTQGRPVLCRSCYQQQRLQPEAAVIAAPVLAPILKQAEEPQHLEGDQVGLIRMMPLLPCMQASLTAGRE
jgi:CxxC-x17-CxxC domain-containing protein